MAELLIMQKVIFYCINDAIKIYIFSVYFCVMDNRDCVQSGNRVLLVTDILILILLVHESRKNITKILNLTITSSLCI